MKLGRIYYDHTIDGFNRLRQQGLDFVEICCNYDKDVDYVIESREEFRRLVDETGVPISCIGKWNHSYLKDGQIDWQIVDRYKALLDAAVYIGANTFVCGCNYDNSISLYKNYTNAIQVLGAICEHARGKNIKVAVENCDWNNFIVSPEQWKVVLGEIEDLYIKYDASHAYNRDADYLEEIAEWGHRFAHIHIKGTTHAGKNRDIDDPPAGMDDLKWPSIFSILYARGYDGDLSIEPHSPTWQGELGDAGVAFTRDFIRQFMLR